MSAWPLVRLGDVIVEATYGTSVKCSDTAEGIPVLRMGNVRYDGTLDLGDLKYANLTPREEARFGIQEGDILFNRTNSKELVGKTGVWDGRFPAAAASYFIRVRVDRDVVRPDWVWRFMNSAAMKKHLFAIARGAIGQANINSAELKSFLLPIPPLEEQQRIGALLDRATEIRRRADAARAKARAAIPALFLDMFGDPATNPKGWSKAKVGELKNVELRNGVSPSKSGRVAGKVLTLSAITRGVFDPLASKESLFATPLHTAQSVSRSSFLICRGNGNPDLVGRGAFPTADMPDTAFPDTIIALRGGTDELAPSYLSALWATEFLRAQIKAAAKTTNGTYKISQGGIMSFELPLPPMPLQTTFAQQAQRLEAAARALDAAAAKAETMAAALSAEVFGSARPA